MADDFKGAIDCDIHPRVPDINTLRRYMNDYWSETVAVRGIESFETIAYPVNAPLTTRPDFKTGKARADEDVGATATGAARSARVLERHLQLSLCRADHPRRAYGGGVCPRGQRLGEDGVARS